MKTRFTRMMFALAAFWTAALLVGCTTETTDFTSTLSGDLAGDLIRQFIAFWLL